jgi:hypothetical protein
VNVGLARPGPGHGVRPFIRPARARNLSHRGPLSNNRDRALEDKLRTFDGDRAVRRLGAVLFNPRREFNDTQHGREVME